MKRLLLIVFILFGSQIAWAGHLEPGVTPTGLRYFVGGVGVDKRKHIDENFSNYSLRVEIAEKSGAYTADARIRIRDKDGRTHLDILQEGPVLVIDLPPGQYRLEAELDGKSQTRKVTVKGDRQTRTTFLW